MLTIELQAIYKYAMIIIPIINVICVWLWSPLKNRNKTLSDNERRHFRNIGVVLSVVEGLTVLSLMIGKIKEFLMEERVQKRKRLREWRRSLC